MIDIQKITNFEVADFVKIAYSGDSDLLEYFWGDGFSLQEAVDENMKIINMRDKEAEMVYYAVLCDEIEIGYICGIEHNLISFGLNINYRTRDILIEFWEKIKSVMGKSFICMLFPQNTRAIGWLKKCGMKEVCDMEENCVVLLNID